MNKQVRVKICGIMDAHTALGAVKLGAHALGFVFAPSKRQVSAELARSIIKRLPPLVSKVGVFVDAPLDEVNGLARYCQLDAVQLHGDELPEYVSKIELPVIKAFRVKDKSVLDRAVNFPAAAILLDTYTPGVAGGTGKTFNWHLLEPGTIKRPLILAGGLTPDNVGEAVKLVRPYAVDVSSGVETNGVKDLNKIALFIDELRRGVNI
ncbi:phosphoribosylanthranilate isomerase [Desulfofalx alkaliphila]|uniref:phosphoribosylanthranilate isomerase n=1 Tax=Desulfofalx alkaliphila TaxID=105483 RepID=UPI0004E1371E|nr:phosphoribosylanthranilate isomerase [Desulfofalx alkaliphila]